MFNTYKKLIPHKLPQHIAFIIDGNGRWAKHRGLSRSVGHMVGMMTLKDIIKECFNLGIKYVSVFAFSTENWNRPQEEVQYLFSLFEEYFNDKTKEYFDNKIRIQVMGDYSKFPNDVVGIIDDAIKSTQTNTDFVLNLGLNYGGRDEILRAVNNLLKDDVKTVDSQLFEKYLYTYNLPDPDFVVRTSGEQRVSNFMLWQIAYSELIFPSVHWPSFNKKHLYKCLIKFQKRNRRFGAIKESK